MSTPIQTSPPSGSQARQGRHKRTPTAELQEQMQMMIHMQYQQQKLSPRPLASPDKRPPKPKTEPKAESEASTTDEPPKAPMVPLQGDPNNEFRITFPDVADQEVGHGTLIFPTGGSLPRYRTDSSDVDTASPHYSKQSTDNGIMSRLAKSTHQMSLTSYGAVEESNSQVYMKEFPPENSEQRSLLDSQLQGYDKEIYGDDDLYPPSVHDPEYDPTIFEMFVSCTWSAISSCFGEIFTSESLHRSLCFGAIDGMLTGSGIVATFYGMELLQQNTASGTAFALRTVVLVFSASACFADAVCMAVGHVWTSHVMASTQARERTEARRMVENCRADAKGQLVDMLLSKGMLKIDAMSVADTLEGYPDLFLAAITGESLNSAPIEAPGALAAAGQSPQSFGRKFPSYGRLMEHDMDPDAASVALATSEARKESIFMMLGFSIFAVLPSLLFQWIPELTQSNAPADATVHPETIIVSVMAGIMWLLGVWKSSFLDSNWLVFGVEAVLVLLLCLGSAYIVGYVLRTTILPDSSVYLVVQTYNGLRYSHG